MSIKIISRGKGKSAVAAAAYRAGEKITNECTGITHDYTKKQGIAFSNVLLPENAPPEYRNRAILWNAVEKVEKASNSQLAREIQLALPKELEYFPNKALVTEFIKDNFTSKGMIADVAFHNMKSENPHAHIMLTMRPLNEDGTWGDKQCKVYHFDENGGKIYDPVKRTYKCSKEQTTDWNERHKAEEWRASWADICNTHLEKSKRTERVDHRSYKRQEKRQIPTIHLGTAAHQLEQRGIRTERGDINRAIKSANAEIEKINVTLQQLESELSQLQVERQQQEPPPITPVHFEGYTKAFTAEWEKKLEQVKMENPIPDIAQPSTPKHPKSVLNKDEVETDTAKMPKPVTKTATPKKSISEASSTLKAKPTPAPSFKPRTLKEVDLELSIVETKLSRLEHASKVIMGYGHKIQDIERNLNSAGFFERRKMNKDIATQEKKRSDYEKDTTKKYGTAWQLESEKSKLLKEKTQIENATGITATREAEKQRKRDAVIQRQQDRDRYNAERKAKRLENPSINKNAPSL